MKRRDFIFASATLSLLPPFVSAEPSDLTSWLHEPLSNDPGPRSPLVTGRLNASQYATLHSVFRRIGELWDMKAAGGIEESHFRDLVEAKTSQAPSYLAEYAGAVEIIDVLAKQAVSPFSAVDRLLLPPDRPDTPAKTRLGRARAYVGTEFTAWYVTQGGFKRFGYHNYRGFIAGPFTMSPPPYRVAAQQPFFSPD